MATTSTAQIQAAPTVWISSAATVYIPTIGEMKAKPMAKLLQNRSRRGSSCWYPSAASSAASEGASTDMSSLLSGC